MQMTSDEMIHIDLPRQSYTLLIKVVEEALESLRDEIRHTDAEDYRKALIGNQENLEEVLDALSRADRAGYEPEHRAQ